MIQRYLYDLLTQGIEEAKTDPYLLEDLFQDNYVLVSGESVAIKTYFEAQGLNVYNGYPRTDAVFPAVHIILGEENEDEHVLADSGGIITDETDPNYQAEIWTSIWNHTYRILVTTEHPDVTAYYHEIVKYLMMDRIDVLLDDGCFNFHLSGNELAPDEKYMPEHLFARQLIFSCQREFQRINRPARDGRIRAVSGIHVDKNASNYDVGDVKTNVVPYTESE